MKILLVALFAVSVLCTIYGVVMIVRVVRECSSKHDAFEHRAKGRSRVRRCLDRRTRTEIYPQV